MLEFFFFIILMVTGFSYLDKVVNEIKSEKTENKIILYMYAVLVGSASLYAMYRVLSFGKSLIQ